MTDPNEEIDGLNGRDLNYENLIVARGRVTFLKKLLEAVHLRALRIVKRKGFESLPETIKDDIKDIASISKTTSKD